MFVYTVKVIDVHDGDTITVDFDFGMSLKLEEQTLRLYGLNAPEVKGKTRKLGIISRDWLRKRILGKTIVIKTIKIKKRKFKTIRDKKGKFGRYLAKAYFKKKYINQELIDKKLAKARVY